MYTQSVI